MTPRVHLAAALCVWILWPQPGLRGQLISLAGATQEALRNNTDLLLAQHDARIAEADVLTAQLRPNPSLSAIGDIAPSPGERFAPAAKYYGLSLAYPLDLAGKRSSRIEAAQRAASAVSMQTGEVQRQVRIRVWSAYVTALALRDRLELADTNLVRLERFVEVSKIRARRSDVPGIDTTRAEYTRDLYLADVQNVRTAYRGSLIELQTAMGRRTFSDSLRLESDIEEVTPPDSLGDDESLQYAMEHRPDVAALRRQLDAEQANESLQKTLAAPDVSLSADYSNQQYANFYGFSVNVTLPLFNRNQGEIVKSGHRIAQIDDALQGLRNRILAEIRRTREEMMIAWGIVRQHHTALLPLGENILKTIEYSYRTGNTTLLDYLEAQRSFTESRISYIDALLRYQLGKAGFLTALSKEDFL